MNLFNRLYAKQRLFLHQLKQLSFSQWDLDRIRQQEFNQLIQRRSQQKR